MPKNTSWGNITDWYNDYLENTEDSYQKQVILPNLLRLMTPPKDGVILDIACGQGFFTREYANKFFSTGAEVLGADIAEELIEKAKTLSTTSILRKINYHVAPAHNLAFTKSQSIDVATIVLAIQNIENIQDVFKEAKRVLKPSGKLLIVMMHPTFRIPQQTSWSFDEERKVQYRRIDAYLSASTSELLVNPGKGVENSKKTISYHRSLQDFSKALSKNDLGISKIEEWISHKKSQSGPRQKAEDHIRKEIPLFMMLEIKPF